MSKSSVEKLNVLMNEVKNEVQRAMQVMVSKDEEIREHCCSLRIKVDAQSEVIIEEVRQWSNGLRDQINEYEKQCLERFNAEEFEASASRLKSLVADINDCQNRVSEQVNDACLEAIKLDELIKETTVKLESVKREKLLLRKQKFGNNMLDMIINKGEKIDLNSVAMLSESSIHGLDHMKHLNSIRDMPGFAKLQHCFINPYAKSFELIALFSNKKDHVVLVKMDATGKILKKNDTKERLDVQNVQTVKGYFIVQASSVLAFDYNLNPKEIDFMSPSECYGGVFAANQQVVICEYISEYNYKAQFPPQMAFSPHGNPYDIIGEARYSAYAYRILASDKYLYAWYNKRVQIYSFHYIKKQKDKEMIDQNESDEESDQESDEEERGNEKNDMETNVEEMSDEEESDEEERDEEPDESETSDKEMSDDEEKDEEVIDDEEKGQDEAKGKGIDEQEEIADTNDEEIYDDATLLNDVKFEREFKQVKLVGDKQIATFDNETGIVCFYTQDEHFKLIHECKVSVDGDIKGYGMSQDSSSNFCFFNSKGDIYHNLF